MFNLFLFISTLLECFRFVTQICAIGGFLCMSVGEFMRKRREELGISLRQLSKLTDLSENRLFRIEHDRTNLYAFEVNRLSQGLYLSVSDIMVTVEKYDTETVSYADRMLYQRLKERMGDLDGKD